MTGRTKTRPKNQEEGGIRGEHGSLPEIASASADNQISAEICAIKEEAFH